MRMGLVQQGCHIGEFIARFRNLANFESVWLQICWFGDFSKAFGSKFFGLAKCTTCIFARICLHICRFTIFKLADGLQIHDIK